MKFSLFNTWPVYGAPVTDSWPVAPKFSTATDTKASYRKGIAISQLADQAGFDYVTVAEHHYGPRQLSPNPLLSAACLAQHLDRAGVAVLGATLPLVNPIRTAEEIAMVDAMTDGKFLIGLFRGTPNEYLTYGTNPEESREVFEEAVSLMVHAWTQPEPFAWVGRHFDYRQVAVWPRPVTTPHPKVLVSANSATSANYAAVNRFAIGISFAPAERAALMVQNFVAKAEEIGYTPDPESILHRSFCFVAETDEKAQDVVDQFHFGDMTGMFIAPQDYGVTDALRAAIARGDQNNVAGPSNPPPVGGTKEGRAGRTKRPFFMGSPDTVARQIREFSELTGVGHFDLIFNNLTMDYDHACKAVTLFGQEVLPQLERSVVSV